MAITLEVKVYEPTEPRPARIEVTGTIRTLTTNNIEQAVVFLREEITKIYNYVPKEDKDA